MTPLCLARIEDLGQGDFVKVDCAACHHVALLTPDFLLLLGISPQAKVLDLKERVRCRACGARAGAVVSVKWGRQSGSTLPSRQPADTWCGARRARLWQHSGSQRSGPPDRSQEPER
jgi:hypothetical protein